MKAKRFLILAILLPCLLIGCTPASVLSLKMFHFDKIAVRLAIQDAELSDAIIL